MMGPEVLGRMASHHLYTDLEKGDPGAKSLGGPCYINPICAAIVDIFGTRPFSWHAALKRKKKN